MREVISGQGQHCGTNRAGRKAMPHCRIEWITMSREAIEHGRPENGRMRG
jgi:hypothetical protein